MYDHILEEIPTALLAKTLRERLIEDGVVTWKDAEVFDLVRTITPIPCVDALFVRRRNGIPEMGFALRNTGKYKGLWWCMGGRIAIGESLSTALKRHVGELGVGFRLAPGLTWNKPVLVAQYAPEPIPLEEGEFLGHEPTKQVPSATYLVELESENFSFATTAHGGQEAKEVKFFPLDALPSENQIAYGGKDTVRACAEWIRNNY